MAIYLGLPSPAASSDLPGSRRAALCFLLDLASDGVYTALSVTSQAVVSYTAFPPLPLKEAVYFCCTGLGVTSTGRYPASCPVKPGLSSADAFRPVSRDHLFYLPRFFMVSHFLPSVKEILHIEAAAADKLP